MQNKLVSRTRSSLASHTATTMETRQGGGAGGEKSREADSLTGGTQPHHGNSCKAVALGSQCGLSSIQHRCINSRVGEGCHITAPVASRSDANGLATRAMTDSDGRSARQPRATLRDTACSASPVGLVPAAAAAAGARSGAGTARGGPTLGRPRLDGTQESAPRRAWKAEAHASRW